MENNFATCDKYINYYRNFKVLDFVLFLGI